MSVYILPLPGLPFFTRKSGDGEVMRYSNTGVAWLSSVRVLRS